MLDVLYYWLALSLVSVPIIHITGAVVMLTAALVLKDLTNGDHALLRLRKFLWEKSGCEYMSGIGDGATLYFIGLASVVWTFVAIIVGYISDGSPLLIVLSAADFVQPAMPYVLIVLSYVLARLSIKTCYDKIKHLKLKLEKL